MQNLVCETNDFPEIKPNEKIAVLLSRYTISSRELLAITFKGKDNALFIGEETAGYTNGNGWEQVKDEVIMNISQGVFIDRDKKVYKD